MGGFERGTSEESRGRRSGKPIGGIRMSKKKVFKGMLEVGMDISWTDSRFDTEERFGTIDEIVGDRAIMYSISSPPTTFCFWRDRSNPMCMGKVYLVDGGNMALTTSNSVDWGSSITAGCYSDPFMFGGIGIGLPLEGCTCPKCNAARNKLNSKGGIMNNVKEFLKSKKQKLFEKYVLDCDGDIDFNKPQVQKFIFGLMDNDEFVNVLKEVERKEDEVKKAKK